MQAGPPDPNAMPVKREKRKLACAACRARRIRCEWPPNGSGCTACALAELRCPGEPEPRKRIKKGADVNSTAAINAAQNQQLEKLALGGALTFHLIENMFVMANLSVPGMDYWLIRDILHAAGGASKEMEIAAECFCSAFVASSSTFSDHATIVGPGDAEMPTESMAGVSGTYDHLADYGLRRSKVVALLAERAGAMFEESGMKDRPGVVTIYTQLAMDQCHTLTTDGGRKSRDYILGAIHQLKHLFERHAELPPAQVAALKGPLGLHLLQLDAQAAAILRTSLAVTERDMSIYVPHINLSAIPSPNFDPSKLEKDEEGWTELGKQLEPIYLSTIRLYRTFLNAGPQLPSSSDVESLWRGIDETIQQLALADAAIEAVPPLDTIEKTQHRQFDLISLTNNCRRNLLRLDLLLHQRIVEAALAADGAPEPIVLQNYEVSRGRVQKVFVTVTDLAKYAIFHRSLIYVRGLFEMLEVCSTWTSLRTADRATAAELVSELGITEDSAAILHQGLALAAWSSPLAARQRLGLRTGMGGPYTQAIQPVAQPQAKPSPPVHAPPPPPPPPPQPQPQSSYTTNASLPSFSSASTSMGYGQPSQSQYSTFPGIQQHAPVEATMPPRSHHPQQYNPMSSYSQHQHSYQHQHQYQQQQNPSFPSLGLPALGLPASFLTPQSFQHPQSQMFASGGGAFQDSQSPGEGWDDERWRQQQQQASAQTQMGQMGEMRWG